MFSPIIFFLFVCLFFSFCAGCCSVGCCVALPARLHSGGPDVLVQKSDCVLAEGKPESCGKLLLVGVARLASCLPVG